jgi:hypothetical protein
MPDTSRWHRHPTPGTREPGNPGHAAQVTHIGARPRHLVERLRDLADQERASALQHSRWQGEPEWKRGIGDAARWALGELENAPVTRTLTGRDVCPDVLTMRAEDHKADAAIRHPSAAGVSSTYANGVQHTLMWIIGDTEESPIGLGA